MELRTARLRLLTASLSALRADFDADRSGLSRLLDADVHSEWPPELYDRDAQQYFIFKLEDAELSGWLTWYCLLIGINGSRDQLIGVIGFKGRPAQDGVVEIGYSVLPAFQRKGYATEALRALVDWAFAHPEVTAVIAQTYPHIAASIRVVEKLGFSHAGSGDEDGVIRFELPRERITAESAPRQNYFDENGALTREFLAARGVCCDSGCRNCPYRGA